MPDAADYLAHLTPAQRQAVQTADRSVLVTAAAGAGKTSVLAERCASLVCDVAPEHRCGVDELLVVTFTEAAAEEMRSRIAAAIQKRLDGQPRNEYLRRQLYQLDNAGISTIHAFCRTLIQRWFPQAGVDPQAAVLAGDEAELLKQEVIEQLFLERYGEKDAGAEAFRNLVDEYGGGQDWPVAEVVLRIHRFVNSLPDPDRWLAEAVVRADPDDAKGLFAEIDSLQSKRLHRELDLQIVHCREAVSTIRRCWPVAEDRAAYIEFLCVQLERWKSALASVSPAGWEGIAREIVDFKLPNSPRKPSRLSEEEGVPYDMAKSLLDDVRELFKERLAGSLCRFTREEYREGLTRIAPHVRALAGLVQDFDRCYTAAKRDQSVVDFDDLQRFAFRLLTTDGDSTRPSEVARQVQKQYRYVLVDEFQDVDPLQAAILHCVSRESADPPQGNLFTVGDIKQSIYRFRLAEPEVFSGREDLFDKGSDVGEVIRLSQNFRSRSEVIEAINLVFDSLMRESFGGSAYDERTRLRVGAAYSDKADGPMFGLPAVELHLLEPITVQTADAIGDDEERGDDSIEELSGIQREGYLIGRRIQKWMGLLPGSARSFVGDRPRTPGGEPGSRPIEYRDIVILLRSLPRKAEPIAEVLRRMGIPAVIERDAGSINSTEFRDVVSLLQVLDNRQQDIPLAAVLRSPLMVERFDENDLMRIRLAAPDVPFHDAVAGYATGGRDIALRERVAMAMNWLDRYRERIRQVPVAEVLWEIYQETGYLGYVSGLPMGQTRREHLLRIHEFARQFGRFARQGLHRFLRFIDELVRNELQPQQPGGASEENAVRIMTIHGSKGLEFPVVILADAHKKFNLKDTTMPVLIDRRFGIGMRAVDIERRVRYPTLIQQLAAENMKLDSLAEELRVWYVALTRAREHLVVVGRIGPKEVAAIRARSGAVTAGQPLSQVQMEKATKPLDWILPAVFRLPAELVWWIDENKERPARPLFAVATYARAQTEKWHMPEAVDSGRSEELARMANLDPLQADEPVAADEIIEPIIVSLTRTYPALELTSVPARIGVSELKRHWEAMTDPEERPARRGESLTAEVPAFMRDVPGESAAARGTATHRFLQLVDFTRPCDAADLAGQLDECIALGRLSAAEGRQVMIGGAVWFLATSLGRRLRADAEQVDREVAFVSRIEPQRLVPDVRPHDDRDVVLIRGIADVVLDDGIGLDIIDYKTDDVPAGACAARAEAYRVQIDTYADALGRIYRRNIRGKHLVFLAAQEIVEL